MAFSNLSAYYPPCPPPGRVAHSHWMAHLPFAFWLIRELRPSLLVELGTYAGVSFCAFCQAIASEGVECNAYAVDRWTGDANMGEYGTNVHDDLAAYVEANYSSFAYLIKSSFDDALELFRDGSVDLLHLDGYHTCEAIEHDFATWLPKMSDRGVALVHDICARIPGYGGVEAWEKISREFPSFAFTHGYGLGVIVTGKKAPPLLLELGGASPEEGEAIRSIFHSQGKIYEWIFARDMEQKGEIKCLKADCEKLLLELGREKERRQADTEKHSQREEEYKKSLGAMKEDYAAQLAELQGKLTSMYHQYNDSLSWRITAPLRKIGGKFRS